MKLPRIIEDLIQIKNDLTNLMLSKSEIISPINGWELTGNNIGKTTKFGIGLTVLETEIRATTEISLNSVAFRISKDFVPKEQYMIFTFSRGNGIGSGFIYRDGRVLLNGTYPSGTIVAIKVLIIN